MLFRKRNIENLYDKYARKLYFTSLRITANHFDAEEAMQDAFIKFHYLENRNSIDNIESWLTKVCIRNSISIVRQRKADLFISESEAGEIINIPEEESGEPIYSVENIKEAITKLPDGYRLILSLHLFEGYSYTEIAQITELKESSVRSQYLRGKKKLLEILSSNHC